ncbi:hypothetical protein NUSPORA_00847 [Nucleospora cyclopteri]
MKNMLIAFPPEISRNLINVFTKEIVTCLEDREYNMVCNIKARFFQMAVCWVFIVNSISQVLIFNINNK